VQTEGQRVFRKILGRELHEKKLEAKQLHNKQIYSLYLSSGISVINRGEGCE
jgi:hypothetical protein